MSGAKNKGPAKKVCFVTIGATASFASLVRAVISSAFLAALASQHYTDLLVQYGVDGEQLYKTCLRAAQDSGLHGIAVKGFGIDETGLAPHMLLAKTGGQKGGVEGVVVSHAGSGTILDALRITVPIIVVPNAELLDNHQVDLAEALAEQGYVVHGQIDDLPRALAESEQLRLKQQEWPPVNSGVHRKARGLAGVMDEEMGFLD